MLFQDLLDSTQLFEISVIHFYLINSFRSTFIISFLGQETIATLHAQRPSKVRQRVAAWQESSDQHHPLHVSSRTCPSVEQIPVEEAQKFPTGFRSMRKSMCAPLTNIA
mgnify:CR=1 FL=1